MEEGQILSKPSDAQLQLAGYVRNLNFKQTTYCYINPLGFISKEHSYCALGGIAKNLGLSNTVLLLHPDKVKKTIENALNMSPEEKKQLYKCPYCKEQERSLLAMIPHFNDTHKFNWKGIADKLEILHLFKVKPRPNTNKIIRVIRIWYNRALVN